MRHNAVWCVTAKDRPEEEDDYRQLPWLIAIIRLIQRAQAKLATPENAEHVTYHTTLSEARADAEARLRARDGRAP